ncbi:Signal transduction histidine kinase CheA [Rhodovulum sp. P5]|uniref:chemotaxis protein CheA n=1 Tax=Rhodovulum sp. P5 TaxID=1564506 RepID=UPI0009C1FF3E|nr:chemotaxis protein CheA [Rhodovulum sp. P5]ARE40327.1 Signal transduction histidine kinase CheA [Rhodovulum sp. P5]
MSDADEDLKQGFLAEARELIERASEALLSLERTPGDPALVAALFRAVHTLKGNSGLFDIGPLTRVVHAGEDVLDRVRAGEIALTGDMADALLDALDQVTEWLEVFEEADGLPADAGRTGAGLAERLSAFRPDAAAAPTAAPPPPVDGLPAEWLSDLPAPERAEAEVVLGEGRALVAIDYVPDEDCFFRGDDPLRTVLALPGRVWLSVTATEPLEPGVAFDPFRCTLRFRVLSRAPRAELEDKLAYVVSQTSTYEIPAKATAAPPDDSVLHDLLSAQAEALAAEVAPETFAGRLGAVARVLEALLPAAGLDAMADRIAPAKAQSVETHSTAAMADLVADALDELERRTAVPDPAPAAPENTAPETTAPVARSGSPAPRAKSVFKVDQSRIDMLMKLAGELIVAKNALPYLAERAEEEYGSRKMAREIKAQYEVFNRIVDELQSAVMQVRMVPLGSVFERFRRLVRDLSRQLNKPIRLEIEGGETEADKNVVESLADPLVHLIRNAMDHGIEAADARAASGKPAEGLVRLSARLSEDQVVIEIADDGKGIDIARVREKAVERGLLSAEAAATLPEADAMRLILQPGFSTAAEVSDLSGRGVGMDVVASMVERAGGTVSLSSEAGKGTTVAIRLPLSMAVRRVMMVEVADACYGAPLESVQETIRIPRADVHMHMGNPQIVLRDRLVPLFDMRKALRLPPPDSAPEELSVLVVTVGGEAVGLIVDDFRAGAEVIPHPLEGPLAGLGWVSGAALLGDGSILLLLDLEEVLKCRS